MDFLNRPTPYGGLPGPSAGVPDFVTVDDVPAPSGALVSLGVSASGPVTVDLDSESPHILVNAPTGLGKSAIARSVGVQRAAAGDVLVILDVKMHSHRWARELSPVAHYADTASGVGQALVNLSWELHRRNQVVRDWSGPVSEAPVGPRIIVLFEETNATLVRLKDLDKQVGPGGSRALDAFRDLMFMGRAVRIHVVAFAQLASYRSGLTADLIENFGTKILAGYSPQAWRWLAADCGRFRPAPVGTGRGVVCRSGRAVETQLVWMPEEAAAEHVMASVAAQRTARSLVRSPRHLPRPWRAAIGSR